MTETKGKAAQALRKSRSGPSAGPRRLELALQGGGAHGAFTWGVLDRLLEETGIEIVALSGASAGAMNAVLVAHGLMHCGPDAAKRALWQFWKGVARAALSLRAADAAFAMLAPPPGLSASGLLPFALWSATHAAWRTFAEQAAGQVAQDLNPLGPLLEQLVDFEALRQPQAPRLFLSATDVATGNLRVFRNADLSAAAVLASACLPQLFHAVEIDGRAYWDGGYLGNPPLAPLIAESPGDDLLVVQVNPAYRAGVPAGAAAIAERVNEITFNASLGNELRGILALKRALGAIKPADCPDDPLLRRLASLRLHRIAADESDFAPGQSSRRIPEWSALQALHGAGRRAADAWLSQFGASLGRESTFTAIAEGDRP